MNRIYRQINKLKYCFPGLSGRGIAINRIPVLVILLGCILYTSPLTAGIKESKDIKKLKGTKETKESRKTIEAKETREAIRLNAENEEKEVAYEDLSVGLQVEGLGGYSVNAIYSSGNKLFINILDLFRILRIQCEDLQNGDLLRGFIDKADNRYTLNYTAQQLTVGHQAFDTYKTVIRQFGTLYMDPALFEKAFGIHLTFNFRALTVSLKSDFELPLVKELRLKKMRLNIARIRGEVIADTTLERRYHLLKPGILDWSFISSQAAGRLVDTRLGLGLGTELLGGEANLYLNYSDKYKFEKRMQQYLWRWVNNEFAPVRQIQVGKISGQSISSIYHPVVGGVISNSPTHVRKASGTYTLSDYTQPGWTVELYTNRVLTNYTRADASGMFVFEVPLVYGYSTLTLKFYGPSGEERSEERTLNTPYNFLPAGEFEYRLSSGILEDDKQTRFARGESALGVIRGLTIGGGMEYLSSITTGKSIPFLSFSAVPFSKLILKGEYDHGVRTRGLLDYYVGKGSLFEFDYTKYVEGQRAILYDYLEERKASLSLPLRYKTISGYSRLTFRQNIYRSLIFNMAEATLSAYYRQLNANLSTYANWIDKGQPCININLAFAYRTGNGVVLRPFAQFNLTNGSVILLKAEAEKSISKTSYLSVSYEKNQLANYSSLNLNLRYDLPFAQTQSSARLSKGTVYSSESAHGSMAFNGGGSFVHTDGLLAAGRGGITLFPFLDTNNNGRYDKGERKIGNLNVKINGGRVIRRDNGPYVRIVGLEPFIYYTLELSENDFENISWRIKNKTIKVLVDPNQFKRIEIPVVPVGEISGQINFRNDKGIKGLGRILVSINRKNGSNATNVLSESDGYLNYIGLAPGEYVARVDSVQLERLNYMAEPDKIAFTINENEEGDTINNLNFTLNQNNLPKKTIKEKKEAAPKDTMQVKPEDNIVRGNLSDLGGTHYVQTMGFRVLNNVMALYKKLAFGKEYPIGVVREKEFYYIRLGYFKTTEEAYAAFRWLMDKGIRANMGNQVLPDTK